jgi:hypothetical protein
MSNFANVEPDKKVLLELAEKLEEEARELERQAKSKRQTAAGYRLIARDK